MRTPYGHAAVKRKNTFSYPVPQTGKTAIGDIREGVKKQSVPSRNISAPNITAFCAVCERRTGIFSAGIKNLGDVKMQKFNLKRILSCLICIVLIAAAALTASGCGDKANQSSAPGQSQSGETVKKLGNGAVQFNFTVTDKDGKDTEFVIATDKKTLGDALLELNLIAGDESEYGLYVKTVNGITLDYDKDKLYWALYIDGAYAQTGVDSTEIEAGKTYTFKAEK